MLVMLLVSPHFSHSVFEGDMHAGMVVSLKFPEKHQEYK